jgi:hypothetical protein
MVNIFELPQADVGAHVVEQCEGKTTEELMVWIDNLSGDKKVELNLTVAKLNCGLEISSGEMTRLNEGREKYVQEREFTEHKTEKPYINGDGKIDTKIVKTYSLAVNPDSVFQLPEVTEAAALIYCQLEDEDREALANAEMVAEQSESKAELEALEAFKEELAAKYEVAKKMFRTRTALAEADNSKRLAKLKKCEAALNFKRWKIAALRAVIQERVTADVVAKTDAVVTNWMTPEAKAALDI